MSIASITKNTCMAAGKSRIQEESAACPTPLATPACDDITPINTAVWCAVKVADGGAAATFAVILGAGS